MVISLRRQLIAAVRTGRRFSFVRPTIPAAIALAFCLLLVVVAVIPGVIAPHSPTALGVAPPRQGPSWSHLFGTDEYGRDMLSRVLWAARYSVVVGVVSPALALVAGAIAGSAAAMAARWIRVSILRLIDLLISFPAIILAVVLATVMSPGLRTTVLVLAILYTPATARVVRANIASQLDQDYVVAEQAIGASGYWILVRHIAVNAFAPVVVFATALVADAIFMEAALSFIGVGIQPPTPSWGNIINDGRVLVSSGGWWVTTFAGLAVFATVLAINTVAEWLSDSLGAPTSARAESTTAVATNPVAAGAAFTELPLHKITLRPPEPVTAPTLLEVSDLSIRFPDVHAGVDVLSRVDVTIAEGEVVGLVGESGSGKSLTALAIMGLLPPTARVSGQIRFRGQDLLAMSGKQRRTLLGHELAMVYQDALSSLNPAMKIGAQLRQLTKRGGRLGPAELLGQVVLPRGLLGAYPHELSGGQRQRVLIAMALSRDPALLIADEPTTALDETVQANVLALLESISADRGLSVLLISHDLALVARMASRLVVLYAGQVDESGATAELLAAPQHPYTNGLLGSILTLEDRAETLLQIPGSVPPPAGFSAGCRFASRCAFATTECTAAPPALTSAGADHHFACLHPIERDRAA